ncbi:MAG: hypothetical protein HY279_02140 [Nitrospinae bacterium]|nr:hypothetical protein [Nitrospinota bacterium]
MSGLCAVGGILIGGHVAFFSVFSVNYTYIPVPAALAAFITSAFFWKLLVERSREGVTKIRAILAGSLSGLAAHYICWYIVFLLANVCYHLFGGCKSSLGEPPADPLSALVGAIGLTFFSLIFYGWVSVPAGALAGLFIALRHDKSNQKVQNFNNGVENG